VAAIESYYELFDGGFDVEVLIIGTDSWESELERRGIQLKDRPGVYLLDEILLRDDATYFDVLHEFGHEALYQNLGVKNKLRDAQREENVQKMRELESQLPLEFLESATEQYAKLLGTRMKYKLSKIIKSVLGVFEPKFIAFNGSTQTTGWGRDLDLWIFSENTEEIKNYQLPSEWDLEIVNPEVLEEGIGYANGVYLDLAVTGEIIEDTENYQGRMLKLLERTPSKKEVDYHLRKSYKLITLAKSILVESDFYGKLKLMKKIPTEDVILHNFDIPLQDDFFDALSYAISYAHIGKEYSRGN